MRGRRRTLDACNKSGFTLRSTFLFVDCGRAFAILQPPFFLHTTHTNFKLGHYLIYGALDIPVLVASNRGKLTLTNLLRSPRSPSESFRLSQ